MSITLKLNSGSNFIFALDTSPAMLTKDCGNDLSRLNFAKNQAIRLAGEANKYDTSGITLITSNNGINVYKNIRATTAKQIIGGIGNSSTPFLINEVISKAFSEHVLSGSAETILLIATNEIPENKDLVVSIIKDIAEQLMSENEFVIQYLVTGEVSDKVESYFAGLGKALAKAKYQIVDVKSMSDADFGKAFLPDIEEPYIAVQVQEPVQPEIVVDQVIEPVLQEQPMLEETKS